MRMTDTRFFHPFCFPFCEGKVVHASTVVSQPLRARAEYDKRGKSKKAGFSNFLVGHEGVEV